LIEGSDEYLKSKFVYQTLNNIGVGEVVLVSPEGPQATFGGIAQVIEGWLKAFPEHGIPVTLISLLYEQAQGNKHSDAFATLRNGINICGKNVKVKYCGEVDIPFGPTTRPNGGQWVQGAYNVRANVYMAESGNVRVFLLRHSRYADRLYPHLMGDEHLRRVIFLGRGALEIMKNPAFGIRPQLIISNDWISALVPVLRKLDWRYNGADNLKNCRTIHLVHNAGKDYQGRFANNHNNQNLYPMLELDQAHWDGLMDPQQKNMFNITSAALLHLNGAIVAVSRTYAKELLTKEGADGLEGLMWRQKAGLFGISNGIDQVKQRKTVMRIGEGARQDLGWGQIGSEGGEDLSRFFDNLLGYKAAAKLRLQRNFGLHQGEDKIILTLVGRLAEQKGISLLMGNAAGDGCSVMELILRKYPETQFIIAGPRVDGDNLSERFCGLLSHLSRCFSGRVLGITEFVPHDFAMEIFTAGDWTLMPSRFEPCGLSQLHALLAGSLVIARNVGGLSATLERFNDTSSRGNGFMFDEYSSTALRNTMCWALDRTRDADFRKQLMLAAAHAQHDWSHRIPQYVSIFQHILGVLGENSYRHLQNHRDIIENQVGV
jgi:starch synthase